MTNLTPGREHKLSRKSKEESLLTRQHIVLAALKEFEKRGVAYTTLDHIAESAGVSRGAIYWHFTNKTALFNEIWNQDNFKAENLKEKYQVIYPGQPLNVMKCILIDLLQATQLNPLRKSLMEISFHKNEICGGMLPIHETRKRLELDGFEIIEQALKDCIHHGELPLEIETKFASILLQSCINGILETWLLMPERFDLVKSSPALANNLISMLKSIR